MTDEDERMDRARRIRELREGGRPDEEQSDDQPAQSDDADGAGDADGSAGDDTAEETTADEDGGPTGEAAGETASDDAVEESAGEEPSDDGGAGTGVENDDPVPSDEGDAAGTAVDGGEAEDDGDDRSAQPADDEPAEAAADEPAEATDEPVAQAADAADPVDGGDADDDDSTIHIPGAEVDDVEVDVGELAAEAGVDEREGGDGAGEAAVAGETDADAPAAGPAGTVGPAGTEAAGTRATKSDETRVLEFDLGPERYCLDIEHVEEIVKRDTITRVPNTPEYVEGVVDLRGQITTILDPKVLLDIDAEGSKELIVVFDPDEFEDQGAIGWVVDDVNQVTPVAEDEVNDSPVDKDHIRGVVDRDGDFVIWTTPERAIGEAAD
ncbi:MAG: chemotaxis protein CheW [Haloarculaceae archaeon]